WIAAFGPLRIFKSGDLQFLLFEGSVTVSADVFDARTPHEQHAAPGSGCDRHSQTAQAHATAVSLVPDTQIEKSHRNQKPDANHQRIGQVESEARGFPTVLDQVNLR